MSIELIRRLLAESGDDHLKSLARDIILLVVDEAAHIAEDMGHHDVARKIAQIAPHTEGK